MTLCRLLAVGFLPVISVLATLAATAAAPAELRCEYRVDPLGMDQVSPRLSWEMRDTARGAAQSAYQIEGASTAQLLQNDKPDLWDSGRVTSDSTFGIRYAGKPFASGQRVFWRVREWDAPGAATPWSEAVWVGGRPAAARRLAGRAVDQQ